MLYIDIKSLQLADMKAQIQPVYWLGTDEHTNKFICEIVATTPLYSHYNGL
jgi:hypothetical protein